MSQKEIKCEACGAVMPPTSPEQLCPGCTFASLVDSGFEESGLVSGNIPEIPGIEIHEEIGEGGFGIVYRASQTGQVRRKVALKILKPGVDTRQVLRRFHVERQALALLEHPNIARIYQAGETADGYPWFTMEYIEGVSIVEYYATRELAEIVAGFRQVCEAVSYAHGKGVIHRDLKPSNVLVNVGGEPTVIDFGVAKAIDPDETPGMTHFTGIGSSPGTPDYMAPEQKEKGSLEIDERVDVYSLGAILFELLAGMPPLGASSSRADGKGSAEIAKPSQLALRKVPEDLDTITLNALKHDPEERYASVDEFSEDLQRFLDGEKIAGRAKSMAYWKVAVVVIVAVGLGLVWTQYGDRTGAEGEPAGELTEVRYDSTGKPYDLLLSPDGLRALAVFRDGGSAILIDPNTGWEAGIVPMVSSAVRCANFSEDGSKFLVGYDHGHVGWYDSRNSRALKVPWKATEGNLPVDFVCHLQSPLLDRSMVCTASGDSKFRGWSDEGEIVWEAGLVSPPYHCAVEKKNLLAVVGSVSGAINLIDLRKGARVAVLKGHTERISGLVFAKDGEHFASASYDKTVRIWNREGEVLQVLTHPMECGELEFSSDSKSIATTCNDGFARIWNLETGEVGHAFFHQERTHAVRFVQNDQVLISGGRGELIRFWSTRTGEELREPIEVDQAVWKLAFSSEDHLLVLTWGSALSFIPRPLGDHP